MRIRRARAWRWRAKGRVTADPFGRLACLVGREHVDETLRQGRGDACLDVEPVRLPVGDSVGAGDRDPRRDARLVQRSRVVDVKHLRLDGDRRACGPARHRGRVHMARMGDDLRADPGNAILHLQERRMVEGDDEDAVDRLLGIEDCAEPFDQAVRPLALLDLDEKAHAVRAGGLERLGQRRHPRAGETRVEPRSGVETRELPQIIGGDAPLPGGRAVEKLVVHQHDFLVPGQHHVDLADGRAVPGRGLQGRNGVLRHVDAVAAMGADMDETGLGGERAVGHGQILRRAKRRCGSRARGDLPERSARACRDRPW